MCHAVGGSVCVADGLPEFYEDVYADEPARLDGHGQWEYEDALLGVAHAEGQQYAVDASRGADGESEVVEHHPVRHAQVHHVRDACSLVGYHGVHLEELRELLAECCAESADEVVYDEVPLSEGTLDEPSEHPQSEHVEEEVHQRCVHKHVRQRLPEVEVVCLEVVKSKHIVQVGPLRGEYQLQEVEDHINDDEVLRDWWNRSKHTCKFTKKCG